MSRRNRTASARRRTAADREQRRQTLAILHARAQRGVLSVAEADRMVGIVTRELADAETLRGQVDDRRREHAAEIRRREAAELAIVEAEQERDRIATEARAAHIQFAAALGRPSDTPREDLAAIAAEAQQIADNLRANLTDYRADYIRTRRRLAAILAKPADTPLDELTEYAAKTLTRNGERLIEAEQRAEQVEAERDELHAALSLAPGQLHSAALSAIHGRGANIRELAARADTAEQRLARIRDMADNWERRLPATIRTATAAEAVRNAANGDDRPVMFAVTPAPADGDQATQQPTAGTKEFAEQERARMERLYTRETVRADKAEKRAEIADSVTAETKRLMQRRTNTLRTRAETAEQDAERFKADHLAACKTIADMHEAATGRTGMGPIRGVVEDVADVRAALEEQRAEAARLSHEYRNRAETAEQRLAAAKQLIREQTDTIRRILKHTRDLEQQAAIDVKVIEKGDADWNELADAFRKFKAWGEEQHARTEALERQLADVRKAYRDVDAVATLRGVQLEQARNVARHVAERADRYHAAWRSARKRAARNEFGRATWERAAERHMKRATELGRKVTDIRATLRRTEDDLADARRRLAALPKPDALACNGADPAGPNSPVHALRNALTDGRPLDLAEAADLITPYFRHVHDKFCTRPHGETP